RYESACERELRRSVAELEKRRKEAARAAASRPAPAAEAPAPAANPPARNEAKMRPAAGRPRLPDGPKPSRRRAEATPRGVP
ncbi:MAG: hypothetical protein LC749_16470, partial [Actinobacteria bacterium]|nr:hypothetical protein [Actinomycetota bacterium]